MLILVRHGRTQANAEGRLQGRLDLPLDEHGQRQALAVAGRIGPVEKLITSPLRRARETAAAIGRDVALEATPDDRWIEMDYGAHDGFRAADVPKDVWARLRSDLDYIPAGGESLRAVDLRVRAALEEVRPFAAEAHVVVVSHVTPIKLAVAWALGCAPDVAWRSHLDQATITRIRCSGEVPVLVSFNEPTPIDW